MSNSSESLYSLSLSLSLFLLQSVPIVHPGKATFIVLTKLM